ncbi:MAG: hypothetical protein J6M95_03360 [Bacilli bacterium]|nr:hypothetical protein [Bacilli bacterium]
MEEVKQSKNYESLSYDELSQISRDDHQEDVRQYDKQQNALCLVVIGGITLVCGILFLILSFVRRRNVMTGIDPKSLPFFVFIGCAVAAVVLLTIGLIRFFKAHNVRKALKSEIITVTKLKSAMMSQNN